MSSIGQLVRTPRGAWRNTLNVRSHYWFERPFSLLECYDAAGQLREIYVNVATPARLRAGTLEYVDYELDVSKLTGEPARIVDEDEFDAAVRKRRYSAETQRWARAAAREDHRQGYPLGRDQHAAAFRIAGLVAAHAVSLPAGMRRSRKK